MPPTTIALANKPAARCIISVTALDSGRFDRSDQLIELSRGVTDILGKASDDLDRFFRLPDFDQFVDKVLVRLQRLQQPGKLCARVAQFFGRALGSPLAAAAIDR